MKRIYNSIIIFMFSVAVGCSPSFVKKIYLTPSEYPLLKDTPVTVITKNKIKTFTGIGEKTQSNHLKTPPFLITGNATYRDDSLLLRTPPGLTIPIHISNIRSIQFEGVWDKKIGLIDKERIMRNRITNRHTELAILYGLLGSSVGGFLAAGLGHTVDPAFPSLFGDEDGKGEAVFFAGWAGFTVGAIALGYRNGNIYDQKIAFELMKERYGKTEKDTKSAFNNQEQPAERFQRQHRIDVKMSPKQEVSAPTEEVKTSFKKWVFGYGIQKYWPASANSYVRGIKKAGFGGYDYVGGWLFGRKVATPELKHHRSGMRQSFFIEKIVNKHLSLGLKYTWFKGDIIGGWDKNTNMDYNESDLGKGYFIYFTRHSDPRRVISLRGGLGLGGTNVTFSGWTGYSWEKNKGIIREFSGWSFSTDFFMGVRAILFRKFVIGTHIQYWYILPQTIDPFSFSYQGSEFNLPGQKINFGGLSVGATIGFGVF